MRWIWGLAIACVVAATGVRPQLEIRDDHTSHFQRVPKAHLSARTPSSQYMVRSSHRLGNREAVTLLAVVPQTALSLEGPHARAFTTSWSLHTSSSSFVPAHPARGPPVG